MKTLLILLLLAGGAYEGQRRFTAYRAQQRLERAEAFEALNVRENITVGEIRQQLGEPVKTKDGYSWNSGMVRAYTPREGDDAQPYIIHVQYDYPGRVMGRTLKEFGALLSHPTMSGKEWMETRNEGADKIWYASWTTGGPNEILGLSLLRMTTRFQSHEVYCPDGYRSFVRSSSLALDVR